jgi:hypothetical protein
MKRGRGRCVGADVCDVAGSSVLLSCTFNGGQQPSQCLREGCSIFEYVPELRGFLKRFKSFVPVFSGDVVRSIEHSVL